jgi:hypothetical protein
MPLFQFLWHALPQQFSSIIPLLPITRRLVNLVKLQSAPMIYGWLASVIASSRVYSLPFAMQPINSWFYTVCLKKSLWLNLKRTTIHNEGLQVNTATRSYTHQLLRDYLMYLSGEQAPSIKVFGYLYLKTVLLVVGLFSKTNFTRQVMLSVIMLMTPYYASSNQLRITYHFLFVTKNLLLLNFLNVFYFRMLIY